MTALFRTYLLLLLCLFSNLATFAGGGQPNVDTSHYSKIVSQHYPEKLLGKMQLYEKRLLGKTEKTLTKLSRWENKIRNILKKVAPETAAKLFGNEQMTFASLLHQLKAGQQVVAGYETRYNAYLDTLGTSLQYLKNATEKGIVHTALGSANKEVPELKQTIARAEYAREFIKERKKLLLKEAGKYIKRKLIARISKESYYFGEALENYKELFSDRSKIETLAKKVLNEIPAFQDFMRENSLLASLFRIPGSGSSGGTSSMSLAGLQTRSSVQTLIQQQIAAGGPNAAAQMRQNLSAAQSKLSEIKDKILKGGVLGADGEVEMPDFKPNSQKSKTLWQRLEYGFDVQFSKRHYLLPGAADIALSLGYKLNDKSIIGIGGSYKMGIGSWEHIAITHQGIGLRSFLDWKLPSLWKKSGLFSNFWISGGFEMNHFAAFKNIDELKDYSAWQRSALMGISKKYKISKKVKGEMKILYDFLAREHTPVSNPVVFRMGYRL